MKTYIKRAELTSFGKFFDRAFDFEPGYNEFILENEYGKSTITDFIFFMLYGFVKTTSKKISLENNLLVKYMPWNGEGIISGALELVSDGESFRIERKMRATGRMDISVYNAAGSEMSGITSPGEYFFGIDGDTFLRTFFIRQSDVRFFGTSGIENALKNLVTTGDENTSFASAIDTLKKKKSKYQHIGRQSGRIFDIRKQLANLELENARLGTEIKSFDESLRMADDISQKLGALQNQRAEIQSAYPKAQAFDAKCLAETADNLKSQISACEDRLKDVSAAPLTSQELEEISKSYDNLAALKIKADEKTAARDETKKLLEDAYADVPMYDVIDGNEPEVLALTTSKPHANPVLGVVGLLLMMLGASIAISASKWIGIAVCVPGIILALLSMLIRVNVKVPEKYGVSQAELKELYATYLEKKGVIAQLSGLLDKAQKDSDTAQIEYENAKSICAQIGEKYRITCKDDIAKQIAMKESSDIVRTRLDELRSQLRALEDGKDMEEVYALASSADGEFEYTVRSLKEREVEISSQINRLSEQLNALSSESVRADGIKKRIFYNSESVRKLERELETAQYRNDVFGLAIDAMQKAYDKINSEYSPKLSENAAKPLSLFTDGKYDKVYLDRNFDIRVKSEGELHSLGYFSKGTADAVYFAVRTAVADMLCGGKDLPLILDDPFLTLDGMRFERALEYVKKLSETHQVILFAARK